MPARQRLRDKGVQGHIFYPSQAADREREVINQEDPGDCATMPGSQKKRRLQAAPIIFVDDYGDVLKRHRSPHIVLFGTAGS
jgi:hypothetical protein